ncbi:MAG: hypothetical protein KAS32_22090, partial [Candidatus Peribacteraceae bacterium]|nr:hypothetical protein [Candidatus Peribacteraceae bacterium]
MRINIFAFGFCVLFIFGVPIASAKYAPITIRYKHHIFSLDPDEFPEWLYNSTVWEMNGEEIMPNPKFRVDGDILPKLPDGLNQVTKVGWNEGAIKSTIFSEIAVFLDKEPREVTIDMDILGNIFFEGEGLLGKQVDLEKSTALIIDALKTGTHDIVLPVIEIQPKIDVRSKKLI